MKSSATAREMVFFVTTTRFLGGALSIFGRSIAPARSRARSTPLARSFDLYRAICLIAAFRRARQDVNKLNSYRSGPDERGRFGLFGGRFVAETLMPLVLALDEAYAAAKSDPAFAAA